MPNLIPSTDRSLASRGLGIERPFILRQTSRNLDRLQGQTVMRVAAVQAEGLVQTEKAREIDHLTRDAMSGQALLAKWRDTLSAGDPFVNDELRQNSNTGEMIFNCFQQVSHLSEAFTLEPGDVIAAGTPAGVGAARQPFPEGLLKVGDVVRVEIDRIGALENTVIEEPDGYLAPPTELALPFGD